MALFLRSFLGVWLVTSLHATDQRYAPPREDPYAVDCRYHGQYLNHQSDQCKYILCIQNLFGFWSTEEMPCPPGMGARTGDDARIYRHGFPCVTNADMCLPEPRKEPEYEYSVPTYQPQYPPRLSYQQASRHAVSPGAIPKLSYLPPHMLASADIFQHHVSPRNYGSHPPPLFTGKPNNAFLQRSLNTAPHKNAYTTDQRELPGYSRFPNIRGRLQSGPVNVGRGYQEANIPAVNRIESSQDVIHGMGEDRDDGMVTRSTARPNLRALEEHHQQQKQQRQLSPHRRQYGQKGRPQAMRRVTQINKPGMNMVLEETANMQQMRKPGFSRTEKSTSQTNMTKARGLGDRMTHKKTSKVEYSMVQKSNNGAPDARKRSFSGDNLGRLRPYNGEGGGGGSPRGTRRGYSRGVNSARPGVLSRRNEKQSDFRDFASADDPPTQGFPQVLALTSPETDTTDDTFDIAEIKQLMHLEQMDDSIRKRSFVHMPYIPDSIRDLFKDSFMNNDM